VSLYFKKNNLSLCDFNQNWIENTANLIYREIKRNYDRNGGVTVMTAAGAAATSVHYKLSKMINVGNLKNIKIFLADERCVSQYHDASNYRSIKKIYCFTKGVRVFKYYNAQFNQEKSLIKYQRFFSRGIDILILSLANDGHIASLFSGRNVTDKKDELILLKRNNECFERITINYNFIDRKCKKVYLLVNSILKKRIVRQVSLKGDEKSPLYGLFYKEYK
jgi:6-phosphogluconolactonase/glucosamine-6-phosphate isomerase/deaminase